MRALLLILFSLLSFPAYSSSSTYTKIANNGVDLPDSALLGTGPNDWACTRDNTSGLVWEVKTDDGGLRDMNATYTNYDDPTRPQMNVDNWVSLRSPTQAEIDAASNSIGFVKAVNASVLCGSSAWRMPNVNELLSLVDESYAPTTINQHYFPHSQPQFFWPGSRSPGNASWASIVFFNSGGQGGRTQGQGGRNGKYFVRLVQQPVGIFLLSVDANGTSSGTINADAVGIHCASTAGATSGACSASLASGMRVTLTATPAAGNISGWEGCDTAIGSTCTVLMENSKRVTAVFSPTSTGRYTKIANNGTVLSDSAVLGNGSSDWACTRDNISGLIWEIKMANGGLRDMNKIYTNYDDPTQPQKLYGTPLTPSQAEIDAASNSIGFVHAVNAGALCGSSSWRRPSRGELLGIWDGSYTPTINPTFFPNTWGSGFWSDSPATWGASYATSVGFDLGYSIPAIAEPRMYGYFFVRLVSGVRFVDTFALSVVATGTGSGFIASAAAEIFCTSVAGTTSGTCSASLASGTAVTLTATPATGSSFTGWSGACTNTSSTCTLTMDAAQSAIANFNSADPAPQSIAFGSPPTITVGGTGTVSATASSGLPVTMSNSTPGICTLSGSNVHGVAAGTCTVAADQAGNSNFGPATQVTQSFAVGAAPLPPTHISITAGRGSATLAFSAPGGSSIARYTASCAASGQTTRTATGSASPLTVRNLNGGVQYQCTLTATDSSGSTSVASASTPVTPAKNSSLTPILLLLLD